MVLRNKVKVQRRFQKSLRIDSDFGQKGSLEGFICTRSSVDVLTALAGHVSNSQQGAFTWTGPYGGGKSSLVVALGALLNGRADLQKEAARIFGQKLTNIVRSALPAGTKGWRVLPIVGRRENPIAIIGEALVRSGYDAQEPANGWNESNLLETIEQIAASKPNTHGGLILFVDEMGKFLEAAALGDGDLYFFQQLAEMASRSNGRLLVIGVLHQAFDEYASRVSRDMRDEWAKIQGRFVDLSVNIAADEQIELLSRAIESSPPKAFLEQFCSPVAQSVSSTEEQERNLTDKLVGAWPLHPIVTCLLGPISRRRFGQNQRSLFGFLNSSEPKGFQDFLDHAGESELYGTDRLWDYLRTNLEPSIMVSPDGHRWALAVEVVERCEANGVSELHQRLLKTIALIDLFKGQSSINASDELLFACFSDFPRDKVKKALEDLDGWSFTIFRKFQSARAIFAGSDFDIEQAVQETLDDGEELDFRALKELAGLQPILAKRHYHETGALRWAAVEIVPLHELKDFVANANESARFVLSVAVNGETEKQSKALCKQIVGESQQEGLVVGFSSLSASVVSLARELFAVERVQNENPELAGDSVARREVDARLISLQSLLEAEIHNAFDSALWYRKSVRAQHLRASELNNIASDIAGEIFSLSPRITNELLNRQKPSSNAIAGQNDLLRRMVENEGEQRLGIDGFPAAGGLFDSIISTSGLYRAENGTFSFQAPKKKSDPLYLYPLWQATRKYLRDNTDRTVAVSEVFDLWRGRPFGVRDGLMPVLIVAFVLSERQKMAVYREEVFQAGFKFLDIECLTKNSSSVQLRWMDMTESTRDLLSSLADVVRRIDKDNELKNLEPIDVGRGLISIYDKLPRWTMRTIRLSGNAKRVRDIFKRAKDPNKFIFDDLPASFALNPSDLGSDDLAKIVENVAEGLDELVNAYPQMLQRLQELMLSELRVPNISPRSISELHERAQNIQQLAGDFRLDAFTGRISSFDATPESFEGIASLAVNKPPRDWVDPDLDRAAIEIAELAQRFVRAETFARVKGRTSKRQAMALIMGTDDRPAPLLREFDVADSDKAEVEKLVEALTEALDASIPENVVLAALASIGSRYMEVQKKSKRKSA